MSCDSVTVSVSSLSAFTLRRSFTWPTDPTALVVEFAWLDIGSDPGPGAWEAGSWVPSGAATLQAAGDDGLYGWVAETPVIGPLPVGTYGLWSRITDGTEIPVVRRDVLESFGSSTIGSASSGPSGSVTAGNIWVADGSGWTVVPVGTDGQILYADSGETSGVLWDDPPAGGGGGGATDLSVDTITATTLDVASSTGDDATIPAATTDDAGLMTAAQFDELAALVGHDHDGDYDVLGAAAAAQAAAEATAAAALSAHEGDSTSVHGIADTSALLDGTHTADGDAHHAEAHTVASHSDTTATGPELDELTDGSETTLHSHAGSGGDVVGPASAIDDRIVTFDGTTGKLVQDSGVTTAEFSALVSANAAAIAAVGAPLDMTVTRAGLAVIDRTATPPGGPSAGDAYLVIATASGDWAGQEDDIAWWTGTVWSFISPESGRRVYPGDETGGYYWNGSAWTAEASGGGDADTTFIYNSSGAQSGLRYNTWADLFTALGALSWGGHSIVFEQAETIPAGAWDLNGATLHGSPGERLQITFADGATLTGWGDTLAYYGLTLYSESTTPVFTTAGGADIIIESGCVLAAKQAPLIQFTGTPSASQGISLRNSDIRTPSSLGIGGGDYEAVEWTGAPVGAAAFVAGVVGANNVLDDTLRSTTATVFLLRSTAASDISASQTNAAGVSSVDNVTAASDTVAGVVELATIAEVDTGTDATRAVTPDALEGSALAAAVTANTAKTSNATHTGEVTGSGALTVDKTAISGKTAVVGAADDYLLVGDASDTAALKKVLRTEVAPTVVTGTTYTLAAANHDSIQRCSNASLVTVTIPTNASVPLPVGFTTVLFASGAAGLTLSTTGITLSGSSPKKTIAQNQGISCTKVATDVWTLIGGTAT